MKLDRSCGFHVAAVMLPCLLAGGAWANRAGGVPQAERKLAECTATLGTCGESLGTCVEELETCAVDRGSCSVDLATCSEGFGSCTGELQECTGDVSACRQDLEACEAAQLGIPIDGGGCWPTTTAATAPSPIRERD